MMMDVDGGGSDFEALDSDEPPPKKTAQKPKKAPAKKPVAKGRGKKAVEVSKPYYIFLPVIPSLSNPI